MYTVRKVPSRLWRLNVQESTCLVLEQQADVGGWVEHTVCWKEEFGKSGVESGLICYTAGSEMVSQGL